MKSDKYEIEYVYKNNGVSYKELMGKILQSEVILNGALKQKNLKMKVVSSCQKEKEVLDMSVFDSNNNYIVYNVGIYLRLSKEDENTGQSESIENQRKIVENFISNYNWNIVEIYIDDGFSGLNFNRPAFKRMLEDIENKKINLVITKDLSRLGRDYIYTGYYLERYFPTKNIRYIAISDGIDTYGDNGNNDISPFKSVINDMYAKDISKK